jgi:hypothetical protein
MTPPSRKHCACVLIKVIMYVTIDLLFAPAVIYWDHMILPEEYLIVEEESRNYCTGSTRTKVR